MRSPSFPSPSCAPFLIVLLLRRGDLAIDVVERSTSSDEYSDDGEQAVGTDALIDPLADVQEKDDCQRELYPHPGEIGAGETLRGALLRRFLVTHSAMKL